MTTPSPTPAMSAPTSPRPGATTSSTLLEVRQYQVVHDPDALRVAVVLREEAPADTPARVRAALVRELRDAGAVPPPVEVTTVPEIDRDPGHGAKLKLVKSAFG